MEAERERVDLLHEEICEALADQIPDPAEWAEKKFAEKDMAAILRGMGYADDPIAVELFPRAVEHVRFAMRNKGEFETPVLMELYRHGMAEPLVFNINRLTQRKIEEGIGGSEGCDFVTEDDIRVLLRKADISLLSFTVEDAPEKSKAFTPADPKNPWDQ
jgi:hypothetical protein